MFHAQFEWGLWDSLPLPPPPEKVNNVCSYLITRAAAGTRVPEQKQISANVLNIGAICLPNPNIDLSDINSSPMNFMIVSDILCF